MGLQWFMEICSGKKLGTECVNISTANTLSRLVAPGEKKKDKPKPQIELPVPKDDTCLLHGMRESSVPYSCQGDLGLFITMRSGKVHSPRLSSAKGRAGY